MTANDCHPNFPPSLSITPNAGLLQDSAHFEGNGEDWFGVEAQRQAISRYGIAGRVWEAAYVLCAYVDHHALDFDPPFLDDPTPHGVIELGSGTGVVAARIASVIRRTNRPGGFVIATDLPDVCSLLRRNLRVNTSNKDTNSAYADGIFVRPLAWGNFAHADAISTEFSYARSPPGPVRRRLTHIVCSDLIYFPELFGPLLRTLLHLTSPPLSGLSAKVVISYKIRSLAKEAPFWAAFGLWFSFQPVLARRRVRQIQSRDITLDDVSDEPPPWGQFGVDGDSDRTFVFVAHRRPESTTWHVPEMDIELMGGVGARGTATRKGDDTFETILFMAIGVDNTGE